MERTASFHLPNVAGGHVDILSFYVPIATANMITFGRTHDTAITSACGASQNIDTYMGASAPPDFPISGQH